MNNMTKIIFSLLIVFSLFIPNCTNNKKYLEGNTQLTVSYNDGYHDHDHIEINTCYANYKCTLKNKEKCIQILYKEAHDAIKKGVTNFNKTKDSNEAVFQFSFALCNFLNIDKILVELKDDDNEKWKELKRKGFIDHMRMSGVKLAFLIDQYSRL